LPLAGFLCCIEDRPHGAEEMIKTSTLLILTWRLLRSPRRVLVQAAFSKALVAASGFFFGHAQAGRVHTRWKLKLPAVLVSFRAALGPGMLLISLLPRSGWLLAGGIALALLSDVLDGLLARRWSIDTETLRRWDTRADTFFYACVFAVMLVCYPAAIQRRWVLLAGLVTAEVVQHVFAAVRYGRHASYHSILSKIWGLLLAGATMALLGWGVDNWLLDLALFWGILCNVQGLAMTLLLPRWHRDVPTLFHAWRLRREDKRLAAIYGNTSTTTPDGAFFV
jgi:CDP-diacylglycerol--glycerol-3-phosphate 3-phosphatidyltransferase